MVVKAQADIENLLVRSPWLSRQLDGWGEVLQNAIRGYFSGQGETGTRLKNILNGVWLGHSLHAAITDLPVGAWTIGMVFDYLGAMTGSQSLRKAGDWATGLGVLGGIGAAAAGIADYSDVEGDQRRIGTVHGLLNVLGLTLMGWSLARRISGDRASAIPLSTLGYLLSVVSADIGGLLVYRYGTSVNRQAWVEGAANYTPVGPSDRVAEGQTRVEQVNGAEVMLTRVGGVVFAIGNRCTHWGCSLAEAQPKGGTITCPCHGSTFDLATGSVVQGPATAPEPTFDVRERAGQIEIKLRPY